MKNTQAQKIALILANIHRGSSLKVIDSLVREVKKSKNNLFIFPGGRLNAADEDERQRNQIYKYIKTSADGIISWGSSIGGYVDISELIDFHNNFRDMPLVSMELEVPDKPVVTINAYRAQILLLNHFYKKHKIKKFAFIQGPVEHKSAGERLQAFRAFHMQNNIPLDERLISSPTGWNQGDKAIKELLDTRRLNPGKDFEAIIACSDLLLYKAVKVLKSRGFLIPRDIIAGGFNNSTESRISFPAFTTIDYPLEKLAIISYKNISKILNGQSANLKKDLTATLVVRRSCGCIPQIVASSEEITVSQEENKKSFFSYHLKKIANILCLKEEETEAWLIPLIETLLADTKDDTAFYEMLESIIERQIYRNQDISRWQDAITYIMDTIEASFDLDKKHIGKMLDKARLIVSEAILQVNQIRDWEKSEQWNIIRELEQKLINIKNRSELSLALFNTITRLGIGKAAVIEKSPDGNNICIAAFDNNGPITFRSYPRCKKNSILPDNIFTYNGGAAWLVEPLVSKKRFLGWAVMEMGISNGTVYEEIGSAISNSILSLKAIDELKEAYHAAEKAERIKSRFLANVSAELLFPMQNIINKLTDIKKPDNTSKIEDDIDSVIDTVKKQSRVIKNILDLSQAEIGELEIKNDIFNPGIMLAHAAASNNIKLQNHNKTIPLISGDKERLAELISEFCNLFLVTALKWRLDSSYFVLDIEGEDRKNEPFIMDSFLSLARKIVAAHNGIIQQDQSENIVQWTIKIPLPTVSKKQHNGVIDCDKVLLISPENKAFDFYIDGCGDKAEILTPDLLFANKDKYTNASLICVMVSSLSAEERLLLYNVLRQPLFEDIPLCLLTNPDEDVNASDVLSYIVGENTDNLNKKIVLYDFKDEIDKYGLESLMKSSGLDIEIIESSSRLRDVLDSFRDVKLIITSGNKGDSEDVSFLLNLSVPLLVVCNTPVDERMFEKLINAENCTVINEDIYNKDELISLLSSFISAGVQKTSYTSIIVKKAVFYLNQHYKENILRWKLAEYVNISEDYLSRIFKKELYISPWEYLIRLRIAIAKKLLLHRHFTVSEISYMTGFSDQAYFSRVFKKYTNMSPLSFRQHHRDNSSKVSCN